MCRCTSGWRDVAPRRQPHESHARAFCPKSVSSRELSVEASARRLQRRGRDAEWRALGFTGEPDVAGAIERIRSRSSSSSPRPAPRCVSCRTPRTPASIRSTRATRRSVCPAGVVLCSMGKAQRAWEPAAQGAALRGWNIADRRRDSPARPPRRRRRRLARPRHGRRRTRLPDQRRRHPAVRRHSSGRQVEVVVAQLPHWRGPADVFHLMSVLSPVDRDLAVVYSPLMPVTLRERLLERGMTAGGGAGRGICLDGRERAGDCAARVRDGGRQPADAGPCWSGQAPWSRCITGREISLKGGGGPTCLTRPLTGVRLGPLRESPAPSQV